MASRFTQSNRPLRITTPLGTDVLLLERLSGEERVSGLFRFQLDLLSERQDIDPASILGQKVGIEIDFGDDTRHINGIVSRIAQGERGPRLTRYRAEVVPQFWLASLTRNIRIFQQKSVRDIVEAVLREVGVENTLRLTTTYQPRNYCAQYRETNFHFLSRLMEEEGIFYFHSHEPGALKLLISDNSGQSPPCPGAASGLTVTNSREASLGSVEPIAFDVVREQAMVSGKVSLWDHTFEMPGSHLEAEATIKGEQASLEVYDYPGEYAQRFDGVSPSGGDQGRELQKIFQDNRRTASIRARELTAERQLLSANSNYPLLTPGHKTNLEKHYRSDYNGEYLIVSVRHEASVESYETGEGAPFAYSNSFTCIPAGVPYAPARVTPRPRVDGSQTATVVGPSGAEIFTDKHGRVKVQFHWDREGKQDSGSSCWVRVSTPWAGRNWGMVAIPRIGNEVIVDFLEGDPDQPIITGMVYNADAMPPYELPDNMTQSGIKTRSTQKGSPSTFNELRFEDKKDSEQIYLHAERDLDTVVENNETHKVGFVKKDKGDQTIEVFNNQILKVGDPGGQAADGSQKVDVYKDQAITLKTGNQTITLEQGNRTVTLQQGNETVEIKIGNRAVTLGKGNDELTLNNGNLKNTIKMGNATLQLDMGNATTKANLGKISEEAMQGIEMKVGQSSIKIDQAGVTIKGMVVKVEGQVQTQVKGTMTQINGDAMLTVKGGVTMIN